MHKKLTVAFICTHNACRSQMAQALCSALAGDVFDCCSAGTHPAAAVNADAARLLRQQYGLDISSQRPKLLSALPAVDIVVTMGCGVACPQVACRHREDWGLPDPTGQSDEAFLRVMQTIEQRVRALREQWMP